MASSSVGQFPRYEQQVQACRARYQELQLQDN